MTSPQLNPSLSTPYPTRRAALDAERAHRRGKARIIAAAHYRTRRTARVRPRLSAPSLVTPTSAVAALVLFSSAALPAQSAAAAAPEAVIAPAGTAQTLTVAASTLESTLQRDSFSITTRTIPVNRTADTATMPPGSSKAGRVQWPFPAGAPTSSGFGYRVAPCATCSSSHQGLDLIPGAGTPIEVVADGVVRIAGRHSEFGQYAVIDHRVNDRLVSTLYAHMIVGSSPLRAGQPVAAGDLVGLVGTSGRSTGAHLHFEVHANGTTPIDPATWLRYNAAAIN